MTNGSGKPTKKPPQRGDALKLDLEFEKAIEAALQTPPPKKPPAKKRKGKSPKDD